MKKVFFVISTLEGGGAERVVLNILKHIDRKKFLPVLVLFEKKGELLGELPPEIEVKTLKGKKSRYGLQWLIFFKLAQFLKRERPDAVVSFMWYPNMISLLARAISGSACRLIASERCSLSLSCEGRFTEFMRRLAVRFLYPLADVVTVNSAGMAGEFTGMFHFPPERLVLIYNPVDIDLLNGLSREEVDHPWYAEDIPIIAAVGRLTLQKGFSHLLMAMKIVIASGMQCRLVVMGKGPEALSLRRLAADLGIEDRVAFLGFQGNPYKYVARSALFVLSSVYEGFPNALLEAISLGVPAVAVRCPTGPEEIITDGINGLLVPPGDKEALAAAMIRCLSDKGLRRGMSEAGKRRAQEFRVDKIVGAYEDVIEGVCAGSAVR